MAAGEIIPGRVGNCRCEWGRRCGAAGLKWECLYQVPHIPLRIRRLHRSQRIRGSSTVKGIHDTWDLHVSWFTECIAAARHLADGSPDPGGPKEGKSWRYWAYRPAGSCNDLNPRGNSTAHRISIDFIAFQFTILTGSLYIQTSTVIPCPSTRMRDNDQRL